VARAEPAMASVSNPAAGTATRDRRIGTSCGVMGRQPV
jgi:hypothetical protein